MQWCLENGVWYDIFAEVFVSFAFYRVDVTTNLVFYFKSKTDVVDLVIN